MIYKIYKYAEKEVCIIGPSLESIPFDPRNSDYQAYLAWVAEGNEAEIKKEEK